MGLPTIVPSTVFGQSAHSNLTQVGQIGCGRIASASEFPGIFRNSHIARFVAVCDLDQTRLADGKQPVEQSYAEKLGGHGGPIKTYSKYKELLVDKSIDASGALDASDLRWLSEGLRADEPGCITFQRMIISIGSPDQNTRAACDSGGGRPPVL